MLFLRKKMEEAMDAFGLRGVMQGGVCVALSGGADSVLLLHLCRLWASDSQTSVCALHVHHGIRGEEADEDENFCAALCDSLGVPFYAVHCDAPSYAAANGLSLEDAARRERYRLFDAFLEEHSECACIATAHNATDQLETVLFRVMRGAGIAGIAGIPPQNGRFVRPLLLLTASEIRDGLHACGIAYRTDSTNEQTCHSRNYIRHEILPLLRRLTDHPEEAVLRLTSHARDALEVLDAAAQSFLTGQGGDNRLRRSAFAALPRAVAVRVLQEMHRRVAVDKTAMLDTSHLQTILTKAADPDKTRFSLSLPGRVRLLCEYDSLWMSSGTARRAEPVAPIRVTLGVTPLPFCDGELVLTDRAFDEFSSARINIYKLSIHENLGSATIKGDLVVRTRRPGDRYRYKGTTHSLKKLFNAAHIPLEDRDRIPVLCDDDGIVWIPGFGVRDDGGNSGLYVYFNYGGGENGRR